jgi:hypothetical protein
MLKGEISIGQNMNNDGRPNSKQVGCTVGGHIAVYLYEKYLKDFEEQMIRSLNIISLIENFVL